MNKPIERKIIDLLRSVMYSDNENLLEEVREIAQLVNEYDGVEMNEFDNRLITGLSYLKDIQPENWKQLVNLTETNASIGYIRGTFKKLFK